MKKLSLCLLMLLLITSGPLWARSKSSSVGKKHHVTSLSHAKSSHRGRQSSHRSSSGRSHRKRGHHHANRIDPDPPLDPDFQERLEEVQGWLDQRDAERRHGANLGSVTVEETNSGDVELSYSPTPFAHHHHSKQQPSLSRQTPYSSHQDMPQRVRHVIQPGHGKPTDLTSKMATHASSKEQSGKATKIQEIPRNTNSKKNTGIISQKKVAPVTKSQPITSKSSGKTPAKKLKSEGSKHR